MKRRELFQSAALLPLLPGLGALAEKPLRNPGLGLVGYRLRHSVLKPIAWACEQSTNSDGSISLDVRAIDDPNWRKGV